MDVLGWAGLAELHLPALGISGGSGGLSCPDVLLPGCTAAKFPLGMIVIPAEFRAQGCASFVTPWKPL